MTALTIMESPNKQKKFDRIFDWAEKRFGELADLLIKKKSQIIIDTARKLDEAGFNPKEMISTEISERLSGYVDQKYVIKVLKDNPEYKRSDKSEGGKGNIKSLRSQKRTKQHKCYKDERIVELEEENRQLRERITELEEELKK